jgi:hypothetical protein
LPVGSIIACQSAFVVRALERGEIGDDLHR